MIIQTDIREYEYEYEYLSHTGLVEMVFIRYIHKGSVMLLGMNLWKQKT